MAAIQCFKGPLGKALWDVFDDAEILAWATSRRPGDLYNGCDFFNHRIESMEFNYCTASTYIDDETGEDLGVCRGDHDLRVDQLQDHDNWCLYEVVFHNADGTQHGCPAGGCADEPLTADEIRSHGIDCDDDGLKR